MGSISGLLCNCLTVEDGMCNGLVWMVSCLANFLFSLFRCIYSPHTLSGMFSCVFGGRLGCLSGVGQCRVGWGAGNGVGDIQCI